MNALGKIEGAFAMVALVVVGIALFLLYKNRGSFNPLSSGNYAYKGANALVNAFSPPAYKDATIGTRAADVVDTVKDWFGVGPSSISEPVTPADLDKYREQRAAEANRNTPDPENPAFWIGFGA